MSHGRALMEGAREGEGQGGEEEEGAWEGEGQEEEGEGSVRQTAQPLPSKKES